MADDIEAILTFTFKWCRSTQLPSIRMAKDFILPNSGISFNVEGVLTDAPHLYEALDQAYQYRLQTSGGSGF